MEKEAFIISNLEEYGKLMAFCIQNDISVWRTYWDERDTDTCYSIDWKMKRCYYSQKQYWINNGYKVYKPMFFIDQYGKVQIKRQAYE